LAQCGFVGLTKAKSFSILAAMKKQHVINIIDTLTPDAIMQRLGVSFHMIRYARTSGAFPAGWYDHIESMCRDVGIECPREIFNWRTAVKPAARKSQEDAA
jgi:hypothetical protein